MALTVTQLAAALRLGDGTTAPAEPINGILTRQMAAATALITERTDSGRLPADVKDEAIVLIVGYLYDMPTAPQGDRYMAAWRYSGAASLLAPWTKRATGITEAA